ncbi:MAG: ubiE/COQ5 methyltransferase family protein [Verrucomicrobiales bacterium]|nr:ubiE/COQ5 methyltransferase family protein [Verrucomicrobiales bacterium]
MISLDCLPIYADAGFYDMEFEERRHELPFFHRLSTEIGGPVLEVACGTGRLTIPIAQDGVDITGLDVSRPMLERARVKAQKAGVRIPWLEQDCRSMRLDQSFALIFSATNAMQHLLDIESVHAFLCGARQALRPGGRLVIDVFNPVLTKLLRKADDRYGFKTLPHADGGPITVEAGSEYRADTQILHFDLFYIRSGELLRTKNVNMRVFFPQELLALCQWSGLRVLERLGDYDGSLFTVGSPKQILICEAVS